MSFTSPDQPSGLDLARQSAIPPRHTKRRMKIRQIWPRSVFGIVSVLLAFSVGATLSGIVLFAYYDFREKDSTKKVNSYVVGFNDRYKTGVKTIEAEVANGQEAINKALEPIKKNKADGQTISDLVNKYGGAVWFVHTLDDAGQPSVGSAFAVASDSSRTLLITSYQTIKAATRNPGPTINIRQGSQGDKTATLQSWDDSKDLALIILNEGNHPVLKFAPKSPATQIGTQIFAMSGLGSNNGEATPGFIIDISSAGIQHDATLGPQFQGGPIVDGNGQVIAVASRTYAPFGFTPDSIFFAPTIRLACDKVIKCPSDSSVATN